VAAAAARLGSFLTLPRFLAARRGCKAHVITSSDVSYKLVWFLCPTIPSKLRPNSEKENSEQASGKRRREERRKPRLVLLRIPDFRDRDFRIFKHILKKGFESDPDLSDPNPQIPQKKIRNSSYDSR
jgi:hypothetical protein